MAGSASNAGQWTDADVLIAPIGSATPADVTSAWPAAFGLVGLLDGGEGFTETRDEDTNETYAWGGLLIKRSKSKHKRTFKFVALEDNPVVFSLINPGSTRGTVGGLTTSVVKVPVGLNEFMVGFEVTDGVTTKRRWATRATVETVGEIKEGEEEVTAYEITIVVYPESDGTLYRTLSGAA
jgi:hypothetical protein